MKQPWIWDKEQLHLKIPVPMINLWKKLQPKAADRNYVFILQKKAIHGLYNLSARESVREIFKTINILTVPSLYIYECIMYVRKNRSRLKKLTDLNPKAHHKHKIVFPKCRLQKTNNSFKCNGIRFYNAIPAQVEGLNETKFKNEIKSYLLSKAYYNIDDFVKDSNVWKRTVLKLESCNKVK